MPFAWCWNDLVLDRAQLLEFKLASENRWRQTSIKSNVWGFQIQPGTRWNPGLSVDTIREYEIALGVSIHPDFMMFLQYMNGTDLPAIDVRCASVEGPRFGPGFYSYPGDLERIRDQIQKANADRDQLTVTLAEQGFHLPDNAALVPIYGHRYLVCSPEIADSLVLSIWDASDAIVYGRSLLEYLEKEVLQED